MPQSYFANPYDQTAAGFYFDTYEDYLSKSESHRNKYGDPVEEYEIEFIDSDIPWLNGPLFSALNITQATLKLWFEMFEDMSGEDLTKTFYAASNLGYAVADIPDLLDDIILYQGTAVNYAWDYVSECGLLSSMPETLQPYFDVQAYARDLQLSGSITEEVINGSTYVFSGG